MKEHALEIIDIIEETENLNKKVTRNNIISLSKKIVKRAEYAKDSGQLMEDRLGDYRGTIEGLGFKRKRRK